MRGRRQLITWNPVSAPNMGAELNALTRAGESLGGAFEGLGDTISKYAKEQESIETEDFLSDLYKAPAEQRAAMIDAASSFVNKKQAIDFTDTQAKTGREIEAHKDNLLNTAQNRTLQLNQDARADVLSKDTHTAAEQTYKHNIADQLIEDEQHAHKKSLYPFLKQKEQENLRQLTDLINQKAERHPYELAKLENDADASDIALNIARKTEEDKIQESHNDLATSNYERISAKRKLQYDRKAQERVQQRFRAEMGELEERKQQARTQAEWDRIDHEQKVLETQQKNKEYLDGELGRELKRMQAERDIEIFRDEGKVLDARKDLFTILQDSKAPLSNKLAALNNYDTVTGSLTVDDKTQKLIDRQRAKLSDSYFSDLKKNSALSTDFLETVNNAGGAKYSSFEKINKDEFTVQRQLDLEDKLTEQFMKNVGLTRPQAAKQVEALMKTNNKMSLAFDHARKQSIRKLQLNEIVSNRMLEEYKMDADQLVSLNNEPAVYIADRVSRRLSKRHGEEFDSGDKNDFDTLIGETVSTLRNSLNFSNVSSDDQSNINLGILKYLDSIQYTPDTLTNWAKDFEIDGKEVSRMDEHELLQGMQKLFPGNTKIGKSLNKAIQNNPNNQKPVVVPNTNREPVETKKSNPDLLTKAVNTTKKKKSSKLSDAEEKAAALKQGIQSLFGPSQKQKDDRNLSPEEIERLRKKYAPVR